MAEWLKAPDSKVSLRFWTHGAQPVQSFQILKETSAFHPVDLPNVACLGLISAPRVSKTEYATRGASPQPSDSPAAVGNTRHESAVTR